MITDDFHSINDVGWYASSYLLTLCAFQLIYGRLYTFYTGKWLLLGTILLFEIGVCFHSPFLLSNTDDMASQLYAVPLPTRLLSS
jgi:hypothetical protein